LERSKLQEEKIFGMVLTLLLIGTVTLVVNIQPVKAGTITVPNDYLTIQEAINAAYPGDIIYIKAGTYNESIYVNKTISLVGENQKTTIIDGSKSNAFSPVVYVFGEDVKNVMIRNFTIRGSNSSWGIYVTLYSNAYIENNTITNNSGGILASFSNNNTFVNNTVINNKYEGILFDSSSGNIMENNIINGNTYNFGILGSCFNHTIDTSNLINGKPIRYLKNQSDLIINSSSFPEIGYLALINCTNITVENLNLTNNYNGILLANTKNSALTSNTFENNSRGIDITNSSDITIQGNDIINNSWLGISLINSPNNTFKENHLMSNHFSFRISGDSLGDFLQDIDTSNTVNSKVTSYLINRTDLVINPSTFGNTSYLALVNCYNITSQNFSLENNEILVAFTRNSSIIKNTITVGGISLTHSSFINLTDNTITNGESGISIHCSNNNTLAKNSIAQNTQGILLENSSNNSISGNDVRNSYIGIDLAGSSNNTIIGNNITDNRDYGLTFRYSPYNEIFHNNFINNGFLPKFQVVGSYSVGNKWDDDYPSGGNYWSDYNGTDRYSGTNPQSEIGSDGIGDTSYIGSFMVLFGVADRYPLMAPIVTFEAGVWEGKTRNVNIISNSTVSNFKLNETARTISFNVTDEEATAAFCRIIIPNVIAQELWNSNYSVLINGEPRPFRNWTDSEHTYIYINYTHSEHEIIIVPEFPSTIIVPLCMVLSMMAVVLVNKKRKTKT
jgi:parallel beta-helix repeat protein